MSNFRDRAIVVLIVAHSAMDEVQWPAVRRFLTVLPGSPEFTIVSSFLASGVEQYEYSVDIADSNIGAGVFDSVEGWKDFVASVFKERDVPFVSIEARLLTAAEQEMLAGEDVEEDEPKKEKPVLHVNIGDLVTRECVESRYNEDGSRQTRTVRITNVRQRDEYYADGKKLSPLLHYEPQPEDFEYYQGEAWNHRGETERSEDWVRGMCCFDAAWVTEIVQRAPYVCRPRHVNVYANARFKSDYHIFGEIHRGTILVSSVLQIARWYLANHPQLSVPMRITSKLRELWEKDGRPGFMRTEQHFGHEFSVVRRKTICNWIARNYRLALQTRADYKHESIAAAKREEESYYADLTHDYDRDDYVSQDTDDNFEDVYNDWDAYEDDDSIHYLTPEEEEDVDNWVRGTPEEQAARAERLAENSLIQRAAAERGPSLGDILEAALADRS